MAEGMNGYSLSDVAALMNTRGDRDGFLNGNGRQ